MDNYKDWIGKKISRSDIITPRLVDHLKKTIDQKCLSNQSVPEGIFLCLSPDVAPLNDQVIYISAADCSMHTSPE